MFTLIFLYIFSAQIQNCEKSDTTDDEDGTGLVRV